ncbi:hydrolase, alpha/beta domain protein [Oesophagostomum dentatum]|uniref:Hydrolase, alpha/beta domain protein n=1 Tax=Oesophagostomum dentatum TaxID=61180 RepID=A0A0B1SY90_OESDE|nr:hydrolase, alpha/beta domain protein [Oesophagostomum dentatum]
MHPLIQEILFRLQQIFWTALSVLSLLKDRIVYGKSCCESKEHPKPKCLDGWDERFIQLERVRLHYVQTGEDDKPLLLMLHGFPEFWYSWRFQLRHFADKYRCIAVDQRGYNLSDKPQNVEEYQIDFLINDVKELIERLGYKRIFLMGHDWGAAVAWQFALVYPEFVEKLVILNVPHPNAMMDLLKTSNEQRLKSWYIFMFQTPKIPEMVVQSRDLHMLDLSFRGKKAGIRNKENFTDEDLEAWKHVFSQEGALTGPINYYRNIRKRIPLKGDQNICKPPTLIVWGDGDPFLMKEGATKSLDYCRDGHLEFIEGASHWVMQDEPQKVNKLVEDFLSKTDGTIDNELASSKI